MSGWSLIHRRARLADTTVAAVAVLLSMLCLMPLFHSQRWVLPAVVIVAVVATLGAAGRAIALPIPLIPILEAIGLIATLTALFASDEAWAKAVPTASSSDALRGLIQQGMLDAQTFAAPVPSLPGMVLLALAGVGLAALSVDTLFVSVRWPIPAGIPLLALYLAPAVILPAGPPWWAFPLPAIGWLLVLAADQREAVRTWSGRLPGTRVPGLSSIGRRTGAVAIVVAMIVAAVLPVSALTPWRATGAGGGDGASLAASPVILDPLVSLRRNLVLASDSEVLRYRTDDADPSYLRVTALESFDGATWRPRPGLASGRDAGWDLPGPIATEAVGPASTYEIDVTNLANAYLPLPYPISDLVDVRGLGRNWRMDPSTGVAFSAGLAASGLRYQVTVVAPVIRPGSLRDAQPAKGDIWPQLTLPAGLPPTVAALASEVTAGARTNYDRALALQRWFTGGGGFRYSTSVRSGTSADYLTEFLTDRVGYCEQFAASMALMARTLGIPSRVVVGFTQGAQVDDGSWQVTARDAHAWPELWFDGVGWVRFEPTPRTGGTVVSPDYAPNTNALAATADSRRAPIDPGGSAPVDGAGSGDASLTWPLLTLALGLVALVLLGLLSLPMLRRILRRHRRLHAASHADVVNGAWAEVADSAIDLGQPWSVVSTPRQAAARLSRGMSAPGAAALMRLRAEVEQVRYAAPAVAATIERSGAVRLDVRAVRAELRGRVRWQVRLAGYCWPSSERRRQRSSMRSMNPGDLGGAAGVGFSGETEVTAGRAWKAE